MTVSQNKLFTKKNLYILGIISLGIIIISLLLLFYRPIKVPGLKFLDTNTNEPMFGSIYLDDEYIGEVDAEIFYGLPKSFCSAPHNVTLETTETPYTWTSYPADCKAKVVTFRLTAEEAQVQEAALGYILLNFKLNDTKASVPGFLYFNEQFINEISGSYTISSDKCKIISKITLLYNYNISQVSWNITEESCEFETLDFIIG